MLQQLDNELNETIELPVVFTMMLDWALRFTNADFASIALYDNQTDELTTAKNYGYSLSDLQIETIRSQFDNTILHRVARSGKLEIVSDVSTDENYAFVDQGVQSQLAVPVMRDEQVRAIILLESTRRDAFNEDHIRFVQQLATRAAVAVDNARLHDETVRERERLSHILSSVGDVVIVVDESGKIVLISNSALSALQLQTDVDYSERIFTKVVTFDDLLKMYNRVQLAEEAADDEMVLPNSSTYHVRISPHTGIGWIIVMQDITLFKEMDRIKSELLANCFT